MLSTAARHRTSVVLTLAGLLLALAGCGARQLMPTPNLYAWSKDDPFADVPSALQTDHVDVLYITDRQLENNDPAHPVYGYKRSRSAAFGSSAVYFGKDLSWAQLDQESRTQQRTMDLTLSVHGTHEIGRFPPTPASLVELSDTTDASPPDATSISASDLFRKKLAARLALTPVKDVYIFVHGYSNTFTDSVETMGELWHFFGRRGVPIAYSWPAGSPGLTSYFYDRESSEFTVYHLKQLLRLVASCPEVQHVHLIGHSRGTDVVVSAVRELHLEIRGSGQNTSEVLKLSTMVLAAPDLDIDVIIQRMAADRVGKAATRSVLYVCSQDRALGLANWLFNGVLRLGQLNSTLFTPAELAGLRANKKFEIVDARVSNAGTLGHSYFYSNPAVSSDLILVLRDHLLPGAANGRPLLQESSGFWEVDDRYPQFQKEPGTMP
jgi:esterase/lipase superfamily enzyme